MLIKCSLCTGFSDFCLGTRSTAKFTGQAGFYLTLSMGMPGEPHVNSCLMCLRVVRPTAALQHYGVHSAISNGVSLVGLTVLVVEILQSTGCTSST